MYYDTRSISVVVRTTITDAIFKMYGVPVVHTYHVLALLNLQYNALTVQLVHTSTCTCTCTSES